MAHEVELLGKFLGTRAKNPDTAASPYDPTKESPLELDLPNHDLTFSRPAPLPPPPKVDLSTPSALPPPPAVVLDPVDPIPAPPEVILSVPAVLPPEPPPPASVPAVLPAPPATTNLLPSPLPLPPATVNLLPHALPPPPATTNLLPHALPPPPATVNLLPHALPPPPATVQSVPGLLPPLPLTVKSIPSALPPPPAFAIPPSNAAILPKPPPPGPPPFVEPPDFEVKYAPLDNKLDCTPQEAPDPKKVNPLATPSSGYSILGETYSPLLGAADPGTLSGDPFMYARQVERQLRVGPGKIALHAITQVGLFAQNVYGTVWNPAMIAPPPGSSEFLLPALDLGGGGIGAFDKTNKDNQEGKTEERQIQLGELIDAVLDKTFEKGNTTGKNLVKPDGGYGPNNDTLARIKERQSLSRGLSAAFDNVAATISAVAKNGLSPPKAKEDLLKKRGLAFENGIIPMRLRGDNKFGFRTFQGGPGGGPGDETPPDSVYLPLCFTDLRPIGNVFRTVYFRPIITSLTEGLAPEWNKAQFYGRVDPVATYMSTARTISLSFELHAFGPEDVKTIYQKLHWLSSMVYPEYDNNLVYRSGPVVRMRIGDLVNAVGPEGGRGLPGIIESLDYDYSDSLWELKENFKLPRQVNVSLTFTVLHDLPIGRGAEGRFGGMGLINSKGLYEANQVDGEVLVDSTAYRQFGSGAPVRYNTLAKADDETEE